MSGVVARRKDVAKVLIEAFIQPALIISVSPDSSYAGYLCSIASKIDKPRMTKQEFLAIADAVEQLYDTPADVLIDSYYDGLQDLERGYRAKRT